MTKRELKKVLAIDIQLCFTELDKILEHSSLYNEFVGILSRFNLIKKEFTLNTIPRSHRDLEFNRIVTSILELIDKIKSSDFKQLNNETNEIDNQNRKVIHIQYLKFCHLTKKNNDSKPIYKKFVSRINKTVDIYDEAIEISISKKNEIVKDVVHHSGGSGILEVISSYPWKDDFSASDKGIAFIQQFVKVRSSEPSDLHFYTTNYYNSFQEESENYSHQSETDKERLILIIDFNSVNFKELIQEESYATRIYKGAKKNISKNLIFKNGIIRLEENNIRKGEIIRIDFNLNW